MGHRQRLTLAGFKEFVDGWFRREIGPEVEVQVPRLHVKGVAFQCGYSVKTVSSA